MRNELTIILDSDAEHSIQIGKPESAAPTSQEELNDMVILDMATLCEALTVLIRQAHAMDIKSESDSLRDCIKHLENGFVDSEMETGYLGPKV